MNPGNQHRTGKRRGLWGLAGKLSVLACLVAFLPGCYAMNFSHKYVNDNVVDKPRYKPTARRLDWHIGDLVYAEIKNHKTMAETRAFLTDQGGLCVDAPAAAVDCYFLSILAPYSSTPFGPCCFRLRLNGTRIRVNTWPDNLNKVEVTTIGYKQVVLRNFVDDNPTVAKIGASPYLLMLQIYKWRKGSSQKSE